MTASHYCNAIRTLLATKSFSIDLPDEIHQMNSLSVLKTYVKNISTGWRILNLNWTRTKGGQTKSWKRFHFQDKVKIWMGKQVAKWKVEKALTWNLTIHHPHHLYSKKRQEGIKVGKVEDSLDYKEAQQISLHLFREGIMVITPHHQMTHLFIERI